MPYPDTPFNESFDDKIILQPIVEDHEIRIQNDVFLKRLLPWLCTTPKVTSYRVNLSQKSQVEQRIISELTKVANTLNRPVPKIEKHPELPDLILIHHWDETDLNLDRQKKEIIVDVECGAAVLRGAHIFAPGIIGMMSGTNLNDSVSIYVDLEGKCKKGFQKLFDLYPKIFIGNGKVKMVRSQLFGENLHPTGIAIEVTDTISGCPSLETSAISENLALLQNIPSIICSHVLNPKPGSSVLDMCASPGNKTTHICSLMNNQGTVIAIDKTPNKVKVLKETCTKFQANVVHVFEANSINICDGSLLESNLLNGPPFGRETFDYILLDAPCSALGKRPAFNIKTPQKVIKSYVPLQRKLFETAVNLLKCNGRLVYSTCTITLAENEGIVSWALKKFPNLQLERSVPYLGSEGLKGTELTDSERKCVQRFGADCNVDSVGFFIASFIKKEQIT